MITKLSQKKKHDDCFLVAAYCDTKEKQEVLKNTLTSLKKYNKDIILFSHYPVEEEATDLTDYTLFDYSNPIMDFQDRSTIHWLKHKFYKLNTLYLDYGYAAVQQWKRGLTYAYELGYHTTYVLNYDLNITDSIVNKTEKYLDWHDNVILDYGKVKMNDGGKYDPALHMSWCALKLNPFIDKIKEINYDDYAANVGFGVTENYMYQKLFSENSKIIPFKDWCEDVTTSIKMDTNFINQYYTNDGYKWILGQEKIWVKGEEIGTEKAILYLFEIQDQMDIEIKLDYDTIHKTKIKKDEFNNIIDYHLIYLPFKYSKLKEYIGEYKGTKFISSNRNFKIIINNLEIPKELIRLSLISAIEVANDNV